MLIDQNARQSKYFNIYLVLRVLREFWKLHDLWDYDC